MTRLGLIVLIAALATAVAASAAPISGKRAFYLTVAPHQCLIAGSKSNTGNANGKTVLVVPCSNPRHQFEVYAIRHGGWGHGKEPAFATVKLIMSSVCNAAYRQLTGHQIPSGGGWDAFAPDPGAEEARYGDKIICSYVHWPTFAPLGSGWHVA